MRILYVVPLIPSPSGSGGRRAAYNHLMQPFAPETQIKLVIVDVEGNNERLVNEIQQLRPEIFARALPRFGEGLRGLMGAVAALLTSSLPRSVRVVSSSTARAFIVSELRTHHVDVIVVDHLNAYGIVRGLEFECPFVYVAHNIESSLSHEAAKQFKPWTLLGIAARIDHRRVQTVEKELMRKADRILFIAPSDPLSITDPAILKKSRVWPELPTLKSRKWRHHGSRSLVFVGSAAYAPNREAIYWLRDQLMPRLHKLDPSIVLHVIGTSRGDLADAECPPNIVLEGFVSDERLADLQLAADLFISPVVLGSGIKIKVLEAASYGIPVIASLESLSGIQFMEGNAFTLSRDAKRDASEIRRLLDAPAQLEAAAVASLIALERAHRDRASLESQLDFSLA